MTRDANNEVQGLKIAYIGGGSRGWAWNFMTDLAMEGSLSGHVALYDIDAEAASKNAAIGNRLKSQPGAKGDWTYGACATQKEALSGADFVVISILPGTFDEMESDVHAPQAYGIYQPVGDTTGPGGLVRALRAGPMFQKVAEDIRLFCPGAFVINYTNPMAMCMRVLYDTFPGIHAVGCCHEVFHTQSLLCRALDEIAEIKGVHRQDLITTIQGVNHFTWITQASYRGTDLIPIYAAFCEKYSETGYTKGNDENWMNRYFECAHLVKFDLFRRYGAIAAAGDRHLAEFNPGPRYLLFPEHVHQWKFTLTPVSWRKADLKSRLTRAERLYAGKEELQLNPTGEEGVQMIKALLGLGDMVTNVNIPNQGQITNVPLGTVVETNAVLQDRHLTPVMAGKMAAPLLTLSMPAITAQEAILSAIREKDASKAVYAFLNDPLVLTLSTKDALKLYKTMLNNTKQYLPGWKLL